MLQGYGFGSADSPRNPYGMRTKRCRGTRGRSLGSSRRCRLSIRQVCQRCYVVSTVILAIPTNMARNLDDLRSVVQALTGKGVRVDAVTERAPDHGLF